MMTNKFSNRGDDSKSLSTGKKIAFTFIPLVILLVIAELGLRCLYFQIHGNDMFALVGTFKHTKQFWQSKKLKALKEEAINRIKELKKELGVPRKIIYKTLFSPEGKKLLTEFKNKYENNFKLLITETNKIESKLIVLFIPMGNFNRQFRIHRRKISRNFFANLAKKYTIDFIDITPEFLKHSVDEVTLLPEDTHLSRFGHKLVTQKLSRYIDKYNDYRMTFKFNKRPDVFGDLKPDFNMIRGFTGNKNKIWEFIESMPYEAVTNAQGLKMNYDITFPKKKQRILILGDSYAFGPYLPDYHTFPGLLDKKYPDKEIINAGIFGYTITDEVSLFMERAKYIEPDITVLQVLENDISDLFYFSRNFYGRKKIVYTPSRLEKEFLDKLRNKAPLTRTIHPE